MAGDAVGTPGVRRRPPRPVAANGPPPARAMQRSRDGNDDGRGQRGNRRTREWEGVGGVGRATGMGVSLGGLLEILYKRPPHRARGGKAESS